MKIKLISIITLLIFIPASLGFSEVYQDALAVRAAGSAADVGGRSYQANIYDIKDDPRVVGVQTSRSGLGCGFKVGESDNYVYFVTAGHIIENRRFRLAEIVVHYGNQVHTVRANILKCPYVDNPLLDLALLRCEKEGNPILEKLETIPLADLTEAVYIFDEPLLTQIVSLHPYGEHTHRVMDSTASYVTRNDIPYFAVTAGLTLGMSGSPMLSLNGEAVGLVTDINVFHFCLHVEYIRELLTEACNEFPDMLEAFDFLNPERVKPVSPQELVDQLPGTGA